MIVQPNRRIIVPKRRIVRPRLVGYRSFGTNIFRYTDSMATGPGAPRNVISPPTENWVYIVLGGDSPYSAPVAMPTFGFGTVLASGGGLGCGLGASYFAPNPTYNITSAISPIVAYVGSQIYLAKQKFIQIVFNDATGMAPVMGFANFLCASGTGVAGQNAINQDAYTFRIDTRGFFQRWNSGATVVTLHADLGGVTQGDVHRMSLDQTVPGQVSITYTLNGVVQYTVVDNAVGRVANSCFPIIGNVQFAGAGPTGGVKLFDCGVGL
jgi:hypothetical protein